MASVADCLIMMFVAGEFRHGKLGLVQLLEVAVTHAPFVAVSCGCVVWTMQTTTWHKTPPQSFSHPAGSSRHTLCAVRHVHIMWQWCWHHAAMFSPLLDVLYFPGLCSTSTRGLELLVNDLYSCTVVLWSCLWSVQNLPALPVEVCDCRALTDVLHVVHCHRARSCDLLPAAPQPSPTTASA